MRILIDTNVFILREDYHVIPEQLQKLLQILNKLAVVLVIHPSSIADIQRDQDQERRRITLSKFKAYPIIENPPNPSQDKDFIGRVGKPANPNDDADNQILYATYRNVVDFLITEDKSIHNKAYRIDIKDRVLSVDEAFEIFKENIYDESVFHPSSLKQEYVYNLSIRDPFFNSLKKKYQGFEEWFNKASREERKCWVYLRNDGTIGALLIYKFENESIDSEPPLSTNKRLKLCTFKVEDRGYKIGELFIKMSVGIAIQNDIPEIYLTHFSEQDSDLVDLIIEYGFQKKAKKRGEDIFVKEILPKNEEIKSLQPLEIAKSFWPNFYDGIKINKFIIPIIPEYHDRLFIEKRKQAILFEQGEGFIIEGNTIKKAYLCHSKTIMIFPGDILLFYRSTDDQVITSLGTVEEIHNGLTDKNKIITIVGKRTVYPIKEIEEIAKKATLVLLFRWHCYLSIPLNLKRLKEIGVLAGPPQSICKISHENYLKIKREGRIDERFAIN